MTLWFEVSGLEGLPGFYTLGLLKGLEGIDRGSSPP